MDKGRSLQKLVETPLVNCNLAESPGSQKFQNRPLRSQNELPARTSPFNACFDLLTLSSGQIGGCSSLVTKTESAKKSLSVSIEL
jgi:hypothetical protein